jgi:ABC-type polysaccharide/polyol phosphate export permease
VSVEIDPSTGGFEVRGYATPLRVLARDLWASRQLIATLARKDFFVKYRRASFGVLWAVGLPVFQAAVLAIVFTRVVKISTGFPYPVFVFVGFVPWGVFSAVVTSGSTAIVDNTALCSKIYFPRAVMPIETVISNLYPYAITIAILLAMTVVYGVWPGWRLLVLVPATTMLLLLSTGFVLLLSALHVYFRDVRYLVQAVVTVWFYITPVVYPLDKAHGWVATVLKINPMTGIVELFRAATLRADQGWILAVAIAALWAFGALTAAAVLHRRYDSVFADLL